MTAPVAAPARPKIRSTDVVVTVALALVLCAPYALLGAQNPLMAVAFLTTFAMCVAMLWRRQRPVLMLAIVTVAGVMQLLLLRYPTTSVMVIPLATYSFARWTDGRRSRLVLPLGAAASLLGPFTWLSGLLGIEQGYGNSWPDLISSIIFYAITVMVCAGLVVTPYAIGRRVRESALAREQRQLAELARLKAAVQERESAGRMAEARARAQIARELHDIVAHSLSVMIVQAEGGKAIATKRPEKAAEVLDTIAGTGRDALGEMRRIVGVLRGTDDGADYAPSPGLADIAEMVQRAGDRISLDQQGPLPQVPETLGLTIYRVTQEAVTNVLKHAGSKARAKVTLTCLPTMIVVQVRDDGAGVTSTDGKGHGLRGMHERVQSMGGRLLARPSSRGGFLVRAVFPMPGQRLDDLPWMSDGSKQAPRAGTPGQRGSNQAVPSRSGPASSVPAETAPSATAPSQPTRSAADATPPDTTSRAQTTPETTSPEITSPDTTTPAGGGPDPRPLFAPRLQPGTTNRPAASEPTQMTPDWWASDPTQTLPRDDARPTVALPREQLSAHHAPARPAPQRTGNEPTKVLPDLWRNP